MGNFLSGVGNFFGGLVDKAKGLFSTPSSSSLTGSISSAPSLQFQPLFRQSPQSQLISELKQITSSYPPAPFSKAPTLTDLLQVPSGPQSKAPIALQGPLVNQFRPSSTPQPAPNELTNVVVGGRPYTGTGVSAPTPPPPPRGTTGQTGVSSPILSASTGGGFSLGGVVAPTGTTGAGGRAQHTGIGTAGQGTFSAVSGTPITTQTADENQARERQRRIEASVGAQPPFQAQLPTQEGNIPVGTISGFEQQVTEALKTPQGSQTRRELITQIENQIASLTEQVKQQTAIPEEPFATPEEITPEPELQDLIRQNLQRDDELQRASGLPTIKSQILDLQTQINATNEAFNAIVKQVNEDPDFPKSLARRRIQEIERERGQRLSSLQNQLSVATQQYGFAMENYKSMAGIVESAEAKLERAQEQRRKEREAKRDIARDELQSLIQSGGIATATDDQIKGLAVRAGFTPDSMLAVAKAAKSKNELDMAKAMQSLQSTELKGPTSYQEWVLAGKPGTYADYLKETNVKAPTVAQQTVAEYAARIEQANPTIQSLEDTVSNMNLLSFEAQLKLPPAFQSADIQQYMQAARNFINAKLRRESGAVISATEFAEARQQYLPQPGDKSETLALKEANRELVYQSLRRAAGNAYIPVDELLGGTSSTQPQPTKADIDYVNSLGL